jgi:hypothetical protein
MESMFKNAPYFNENLTSWNNKILRMNFHGSSANALKLYMFNGISAMELSNYPIYGLEERKRIAKDTYETSLIRKSENAMPTTATAEVLVNSPLREEIFSFVGGKNKRKSLKKKRKTRR